MPNVFFNLKLTWATVTDDIRVSVYNPLDLSTPIASQQQNAPHIDQQFSFPGLPRQNFVYKILQTEINGSTVIAQLGQASFVAANDELTQKAPILIQVGVSFIPGTSTVWPAGVNNVTVPDFIGQAFQIYGRPGLFPIKDDGVNHVDSSFDPATGKIQLLYLDDTFQDQEYWYFSFLPVISASSGGTGGGGTSSSGFTEILEVIEDTTLTTADLGKKILINPSGNYLEITLPDYTSATANIFTYFQMMPSATNKCALIKCFSGQQFTYGDYTSNLWICNNESFELYKRVVSTGVYQWLIQNEVGNFLDAGEFVWIDLLTANVFNLIEATGANCDYQQYARLYNRRILRGGDGITYASWSGANIFTRMKFSLKDTASNNFRIPDLNTNPIYLRPRGAGSAGDYIGQQILQHQHMESIGQLPSPPFGQTGAGQHGVIGGYKDTGDRRYDLTSRAIKFDVASGLYLIIDGPENNPNSRASGLYIKF